MAIRILCSLLLSAGLLCCFGCSQLASPHDQAVAAVKQADEAFAKGDYNAAIQHFDKAIQLDPDFAHPYHGRGAAFLQKGEFDKAIDSYNDAIRLEPQNEVAMFDRALAYWEKGDAKQAIQEFQALIHLNPTDHKPYNGLAWALATAPQDDLRDGKMAVEFATKGCELTEWKNPYHLSTLAAAYAETGDFEEALKWHKQAMDLPDYPADKMDRAKERLKLYEQGKPYREIKGMPTPEISQAPSEPAPIKPDWPFQEAPDTAVISLARIVKGSSPILYVVHDADGDWQFLDGGEVAEADAATVSLQNIVDHDSTIKSLADLPVGWAAERSAVDEKWQRFEK